MKFRKTSIMGMIALGVAASGAQAQDSAALEEVVVTGYRGSLLNAADAKRESVNVTDSVFAEDIGKFSDLNIAEAVNRIPGMSIVREVDGSGVNISIRGLGTNFTKILMNGAPIAVASTGRIDAQNQNREVDLDLFPTELFSRLDVNKTPTAGMLEGGVAGSVDMRTLRPFDSDERGFVFNYQVQGSYSELSKDTSPRASFITSWTDDTLGVLVGLATVQNKVTTEGYETFGYTNANLRYNQCGVAPPVTDPVTPDDQAAGTHPVCNPIGGDGYVIPATVPAGAGAGLVEGTVIDEAFLLANNPGLTIQQISDGIFPRIGRPHYSEGDRDRDSALISFEARPSDSMQFSLDVLWGEGDRDFNRLDMMLVGRNSQVIPINMEVDSNNVITSATFANAQFFLEARPYKEKVDYLSISPGASFRLSDSITLDTTLYSTDSDFRREAPTIGVTTNMGQGVTAVYRNQGGDIPIVTALDANGNVLDLNDPNQVAGWGWERAFVQSEERSSETAGLHIDTTFGDDANNIKLGLAYDEANRKIQGLDNVAAYQLYACGDPCRGGPGAAVTNDQLSQYLVPSEAGFISVDYNALFAATNYAQFLADEQPSGNSNTGALSGEIDEETLGFYAEMNGSTDIFNRQARFNLGARLLKTDQLVSGPVSFQTEWQTLTSDYETVLPSFNAAFDISDDVVLRLSASQTLTRANPTSMLPATTFSDPSAQLATQGNPNLQPYKSTNFDIGGEWYTGEEGYVSLNYFHKQINGFTVNGENTVPFLSLGIPWEDLSDPQRDAITAVGGPDVAEVTVRQQVNADGLLTVRGYELSWSQPLSMWLEGLGFFVNYTDIHQQSSGQGLPAIVTGTSPVTYNFTGYYENYDFSFRMSYTWYDEQYQSQLGNNNIDVYRFQEARGQWDISASYELTGLPTSPAITLNLINIAGDPEREIFGYSNAPYLYYDPGFTAVLGVRGSF